MAARKRKKKSAPKPPEGKIVRPDVEPKVVPKQPRGVACQYCGAPSRRKYGSIRVGFAMYECSTCVVPADQAGEFTPTVFAVPYVKEENR